MESNTDYCGFVHGGRHVETDLDGLNVEMNDFTMLPGCRGRNLAWHLLSPWKRLCATK
jgi:hypothetical protein